MWKHGFNVNEREVSKQENVRCRNRGAATLLERPFVIRSDLAIVAAEGVNKETSQSTWAPKTFGEKSTGIAQGRVLLQ